MATISRETPLLSLKHGSVPNFMTARIVPFALQTAFEAELKKLQDMGVVSPLPTSNYATPLVPVVKKDGAIRLCDDYKVSINPCVDTECYPFPRVHDLFAELAGGHKFSNIGFEGAGKAKPSFIEPSRQTGYT